MWTKQHATVALRDVVTLAGVLADGYALHSLNIGGATHLSAGGASEKTLQLEGRWASDAFKSYVRSHGKDASRVANAMAQEGMGNGIQPGHGGKLTSFLSWGSRSTKHYHLCQADRKEKLDLAVRILRVQKRG